jgi:hypothetical protein
VFIRRDPLTGEEIDIRGSEGMGGGGRSSAADAEWLRQAADSQLLREQVCSGCLLADTTRLP